MSLFLIKTILSRRVAPPAETGVRLVMSNYCDLCGATSTERTALLAWAESAENNGYYTKLVAFYPVVGNSLANKTYNALDPLDDTTALKLTLTGGSNNADGISFLSTEWADTNLDWSYIQDAPKVGGGHLLGSAINNFFIGSEVTGQITLFSASAGAATAYPNIANNSSGIAYTGGNVVGRKYFQRTTAGNLEYWNDGTLKGTDAKSANSVSNSNIYLNRNVSTNGEAVVMSYAIIAMELTAGEVADLDSDLSTLMAALGRPS